MSYSDYAISASQLRHIEPQLRFAAESLNRLLRLQSQGFHVTDYFWDDPGQRSYWWGENAQGEYEWYLSIVKRPMGLSKVKRNLLNGIYREFSELSKDVQLVFDNSMIVNDNNHGFHIEASKLKAEWGKITKQNTKRRAQSSSTHAVKRQKQNSGIVSADIQRYRKNRSASFRQLRTKLQGFDKIPVSGRLLKLLREVCRELMNMKQGTLQAQMVFGAPVNQATYPDYTLCVEEPMDFGTIDGKLRSQTYTTLKQFAQDVELVWLNCRTFNHQGDIFFNFGEFLQRAFHRKLENKVIPFVQSRYRSGNVVYKDEDEHKPIEKPNFVIKKRKGPRMKQTNKSRNSNKAMKSGSYNGNPFTSESFRSSGSGSLNPFSPSTGGIQRTYSMGSMDRPMHQKRKRENEDFVERKRNKPNPKVMETSDDSDDETPIQFMRRKPIPPKKASPPKPRKLRLKKPPKKTIQADELSVRRQELSRNARARQSSDFEFKDSSPFNTDSSPFNKTNSYAVSPDLTGFPASHEASGSYKAPVSPVLGIQPAETAKKKQLSKFLLKPKTTKHVQTPTLGEQIPAMQAQKPGKPKLRIPKRDKARQRTKNDNDAFRIKSHRALKMKQKEREQAEQKRRLEQARRDAQESRQEQQRDSHRIAKQQARMEKRMRESTAVATIQAYWRAFSAKTEIRRIMEDQKRLRRKQFREHEEYQRRQQAEAQQRRLDQEQEQIQVQEQIRERQKWSKASNVLWKAHENYENRKKVMKIITEAVEETRSQKHKAQETRAKWTVDTPQPPKLQVEKVESEQQQKSNYKRVKRFLGKFRDIIKEQELAHVMLPVLKSIQGKKKMSTQFFRTVITDMHKILPRLEKAARQGGLTKDLLHDVRAMDISLVADFADILSPKSVLQMAPKKSVKLKLKLGKKKKPKLKFSRKSKQKAESKAESISQPDMAPKTSESMEIDVVGKTQKKKRIIRFKGQTAPTELSEELKLCFGCLEYFWKEYRTDSTWQMYMNKIAKHLNSIQTNLKMGKFDSSEQFRKVVLDVFETVKSECNDKLRDHDAIMATFLGFRFKQIFTYKVTILDPNYKEPESKIPDVEALKNILASIMQVEEAQSFIKPFDPLKELKDNFQCYYLCVLEPMCLDDVQKQLNCNLFTSNDEFHSKVMLVLNNALRFFNNTTQDGTRKRHAAHKLSSMFEERYNALIKHQQEKKRQEAESQEKSAAEKGEYTVERIMDERQDVEGNKLYLVKWEGYSEVESTWESLANLSNAPDAINNWIVHKENEKMKRKIELDQRSNVVDFAATRPTARPKLAGDSLKTNPLAQWDYSDQDISSPHTRLPHPRLSSEIDMQLRSFAKEKTNYFTKTRLEVMLDLIRNQSKNASPPAAVSRIKSKESIVMNRVVPKKFINMKARVYDFNRPRPPRLKMKSMKPRKTFQHINIFEVLENPAQ